MIGTGFMLNGILARVCPHQVRRAAREHAGTALPSVGDEEGDHLDEEREGVELPVLRLDLVGRDDCTILGEIDGKLQPATYILSP